MNSCRVRRSRVAAAKKKADRQPERILQEASGAEAEPTAEAEPLKVAKVAEAEAAEEADAGAEKERGTVNEGSRRQY